MSWANRFLAIQFFAWNDRNVKKYFCCKYGVATMVSAALVSNVWGISGICEE